MASRMWANCFESVFFSFLTLVDENFQQGRRDESVFYEYVTVRCIRSHQSAILICFCWFYLHAGCGTVCVCAHVRMHTHAPVCMHEWYVMERCFIIVASLAQSACYAATLCELHSARCLFLRELLQKNNNNKNKPPPPLPTKNAAFITIFHKYTPQNEKRSRSKYHGYIVLKHFSEEGDFFFTCLHKLLKWKFGGAHQVDLLCWADPQTKGWTWCM